MTKFHSNPTTPPTPPLFFLAYIKETRIDSPIYNPIQASVEQSACLIGHRLVRGVQRPRSVGRRIINPIRSK